MSIVSERIKTLRDELNYSQDELAKKINISRLSIGNYESGKRTPDLDTLKNLAIIFGVSTDYIIGITDAKKSENQIIVSELGFCDHSIDFLKYLNKEKHKLLDILDTMLTCREEIKDLLDFVILSTSKESMMEHNEQNHTVTISSELINTAYEKKALDKLSRIMVIMRTSNFCDFISNAE